MKNFDDVFGLAFKDYMNGKSDATIIVKLDVAEDETLPAEYFFRDANRMPLEEQKALDMCHGSILDAGAGAGSHSLELMKRGYEVLPLDISEGAVEIMKSRGLNNAICADIFEYQQKKFDTILFLMNGIGMAKNLKGLGSLLKKVKMLLNPDGQILLDSTDLIYLFRDEDGSFLINLAGKYYGEVRYRLSYNGCHQKPFQWLYVDFGTLSDIADKSGFEAEMLMEGEQFHYLAGLTHKK